ncbi:MAG: alternative ribosome rescue aminoacyl-tRNA hydrolase ArfB [Thiohalomonadales bacterium]
MIVITNSISIDEEDIQIRSIYSSGAGGQHVNKNMTAIQLRFNILQCQALPHDVQQRLIHLGGARVNSRFELVITARTHRSQERNRREALQRLFALITTAAIRPRRRLKKRRTRRANQNRLDEKRKRSETKKMRRSFD